MRTAKKILISILFFPLTIQAQESEKTTAQDCSQLETAQSDSEGAIWSITNKGNCPQGYGLPTPEEAICMCETVKKLNKKEVTAYSHQYGIVPQKKKRNPHLPKQKWYWTNAEVNDHEAYAVKMRNCKLYVKAKKNPNIFARCVKQ